MCDFIENSFNMEVQPERMFSDYTSTILRAPSKPLIVLKKSLTENTGPLFEGFKVGILDHDLTKNAIKNGEPIGERILVHGKVRNEKGNLFRIHLSKFGKPMLQVVTFIK